MSSARGRARARGLLEQAQRHLLIGLARYLHHEQTLRGVRLDAAPGAEDAAEAVLAREGGGVEVGVSRRVLRRRRLEVRASVEYTRACLCLSRAIAIVER